jgi:hypothetical protein
MSRPADTAAWGRGMSPYVRIVLMSCHNSQYANAGATLWRLEHDSPKKIHVLWLKQWAPYSWQAASYGAGIAERKAIDQVRSASPVHLSSWLRYGHPHNTNTSNYFTYSKPLIVSTEEEVIRISEAKASRKRQIKTNKWENNYINSANFAEKQRSLGRYSSFADSGHWVQFN